MWVLEKSDWIRRIQWDGFGAKEEMVRKEEMLRRAGTKGKTYKNINNNMLINNLGKQFLAYE